MAPTSTTTFGVPSGNDALTVRYGVARGVFAQAGIHLEVKTVFGGTELARAFAAGEIEIGSLGSPSGLNAMAAGAPLRIIGSGCRRQAHLYLGDDGTKQPGANCRPAGHVDNATTLTMSAPDELRETDVFVSGKQLLKNGEVITINEEEVHQKVKTLSCSFIN